MERLGSFWFAVFFHKWHSGRKFKINNNFFTIDLETKYMKKNEPKRLTTLPYINCNKYIG